MTRLFYPDGRPFLRFAEVKAALEVAERQLSRIKELGRKVLAGLATPEEITEFATLMKNGG
jgi:hypothetical protein